MYIDVYMGVFECLCIRTHLCPTYLVLMHITVSCGYLLRYQSGNTTVCTVCRSFASNGITKTPLRHGNPTRPPFLIP